MKKLTLGFVSLLGMVAVVGSGFSRGVPSSSPSVNPSPAPSVDASLPNSSNSRVKLVSKGSAVAGLSEVERTVNRLVQGSCVSASLGSPPALVQPGKTLDGQERTSAQVVSHLRGLQGQCVVFVFHQPWYKRWSSMVGETYADGTIGVRDDRWPGLGPVGQASLIAHECWGHKLGSYEHDWSATARRPNTVPYRLNRAIEDCMGLEKGAGLKP